MFDSHIHSFFSKDSEMKVEDACEKARSIGLDGIAFTDHLDIEYPEKGDFGNIDFDYYSSFMDDLKAKQLGGFKVLKGIEVGIQPHVIEKTKAVVMSHNFDYVLASVHMLDGEDPYESVYFLGKSKREAFERYFTEILFMIKNFSDFNNVGHFEYITRKSCYDDRSILYKDYSETFDEIFRELIHQGKGFEVNTASFRDKPGISTSVYDIDVLKRYRKLGGEIISLGSDSHTPNYIGYKFEYFRDLIEKAGFKYTAHFENRKPVFDKI
jgi:histidinol-phosphatase (PHP family)